MCGVVHIVDYPLICSIPMKKQRSDSLHSQDQYYSTLCDNLCLRVCGGNKWGSIQFFTTLPARRYLYIAAIQCFDAFADGDTSASVSSWLLMHVRPRHLCIRTKGRATQVARVARKRANEARPHHFEPDGVKQPQQLHQTKLTNAKTSKQHF